MPARAAQSQDAIPSKHDGTRCAPDVPRALAAAWQAANLYEPSHPVVKSRLKEFSEATQALTKPLRLLVEPTHIVCDNATLGPEDFFRGLAETLHRQGLAAVEFQGAMNEQQSEQFMRILHASKAQIADYTGGSEEVEEAKGLGSEQSLAEHIGSGCGGKVRAFQLSAHAVRLKAAGTSGKEEVEQSFSAVAASCIANVGGDLQTGFADETMTPTAMDMAATYRQMQCEGVASQKASSKSRIAQLYNSLTEEQKRDLVENLRTNGEIKFEEATGILTLLPLEEMTRAIGVLQRSDSTMSKNSLMLLKRLSGLALGSKTELSRLARVAEDWSSASSDDREGEPKMAETMAQLLKQVSDVETRSTEYTDMLRQLAETAVEGDEGLSLRMAEEMAQVSVRAVESVCEVLRKGVGDSEERRAILGELEERGQEVAQKGGLDAVMDILEVTRDIERAPKSVEERAAAQKLLSQAERQVWLAQALSAYADEGLVARVVASCTNGDEESVRVLAYAAVHSRSKDAKSMFERMVSQRPAAVVDSVLTKIVAEEPATMETLSEWVVRFCRNSYLDLLRPGLTSVDERVRIAAYRALTKVQESWPRDLAIRGLSDMHPVIRRMTENEIGRQKDSRMMLLVDRLAGQLGIAEVSRAEAAHLEALIRADTSQLITARLAFRLMTCAVMPSSGEGGGRMLVDLLKQRPKMLVSVLARAMWKLSPVRWMAGRKGGTA
ncbi:MAG TPA: hypothetical protein VG711_01500 [Phycisphaerales bacterium]|nr:hypothetical protein [Phycisphaerales bacterium]